jgi:hypothetical protein
MPPVLVIVLALVVAGSIAILMKWEYRRFRRRQPACPKILTRDSEPERAYTAPREHTTRRAFEHDSGRR